MLPLELDTEVIIETEDDGLPALDPESDSEPTHLHCGDCSQLVSVVNLALQADGRRTCEACAKTSVELADLRRDLEEAGQERLF